MRITTVDADTLNEVSALFLFFKKTDFSSCRCQKMVFLKMKAFKNIKLDSEKRMRQSCTI